MKKIWVFGLCLVVLLTAAVSALADTISLTSNYQGLPQYNGVYVGPIGATLNGTTTAIDGGIACLDMASTSYFGATIGVTIGTLEPLNMSNARHGSDAAALFKYEEAAWLLGQIASHPTQAGEIQFAMWKVFNETYANNYLTSKGLEVSTGDSWLALAAAINPQDYDFSSVRIYTPTAAYASNQEFMSGGAISLTPQGNPVPVPASFILLGSGLLVLAPLVQRRQATLVRRGRK